MARSINKKAHGLKAQPLKDFHSWQQSKCEEKIAKTHPNKCTQTTHTDI